MVHETLEYYRNDLHALPLKLQTQLSDAHRCRTEGPVESRQREIGDTLPGGDICNIHAYQQKVSISTFEAECIPRYKSMQKLTQSFKDTES